MELKNSRPTDDVNRRPLNTPAVPGTGPKALIPAGAGSRGTRAMTLVEMLVAVAVGSLILMVVAMVFMNGTRAFAAASNYINMDSDSRNTLDHLSQEIRQAGNLVAFSPTQLKFGYRAQTNSFLVFNWDATSGQLTEWNTANTTTNILLKGCDQLSFALYNSSFAPTTNAAQGKGISVSWACSRTILGRKSTTENMQEALIVIRNKPL
jgi:prepilin-type N-terminal cleavage/methylation domain-containing protein